MIKAYLAGVPGNGCGGWGYAVFDYDTASDTFTPGTLAGKPPQGNDAKYGFACHTDGEDERLRFHGLRA